MSKQSPLLTPVVPAVTLEQWIALARDALVTRPRSERQEQASLWYLVSHRILNGRIPEHILGRWFGLDAAIQGRLMRVDQSLPQFPSASLEELTHYFEQLAHGSDATTRKRDIGAYFTPFWLSQRIVELTLEPLIRESTTREGILQLTVCDPAAGAGAFALPALDLLSRAIADRQDPPMPISRARSLVLAHCLFLVDRDAVTVGFVRAVLASLLDVNDVDTDTLERMVVCGDSVLGEIEGKEHSSVWKECFPEVLERGGFSAIVGNPPWGTVKPSIREHFGALDPSLLNLQGQALRIHLQREYQGDYDEWILTSTDKQQYARALRESSGYKLQGPGDSEFYRFFVERALSLLHPQGRLGFVVPSSLRTAEGAAPLRRALLSSGGIEVLLDVLNTGRIFDIHSMFRFLVFVWSGKQSGGINRARFSLASREDVEAYLRKPRSGVALSNAYLRSTSGQRMTIPAVANAASVRLLRHLHKMHPPLEARLDDTWNVTFTREYDMTNDSHLFVASSPSLLRQSSSLGDGSILHPKFGRLLPVYEGRMVHQFDSAAKAYESGHGRSAKWRPLLAGSKEILPHYYLPEVERDEGVAPSIARAGFCDVSGHANERTVLASLIPAAAVCGNKVPTCRFDSDDTDLHLLWVAMANSLVVDWIVRRRVGTSLNFFQWYQVPFPRISTTDPIGRELIRLSRTVASCVFSASSEAYRSRGEARARIDGIVLSAFGLGIHDAIVILQDFPLLDKGAPAGLETATRDRLLLECVRSEGESDAHLSDLGLDPGSGADSLCERVENAEAAFVWAYVPRELRPLPLEREGRG